MYEVAALVAAFSGLAMYGRWCRFLDASMEIQKKYLKRIGNDILKEGPIPNSLPDWIKE
jgi:hypothetical protein